MADSSLRRQTHGSWEPSSDEAQGSDASGRRTVDRAAPRARLALRVDHRAASEPDFVEDVTKDVSRSGVFIRSHAPDQEATLLKLKLRPQTDQPPIEGVGRVVWVRRPGDSDPAAPAGMGVQFINLSQRDQAALDRLMVDHERSQARRDRHAVIAIAMLAGAALAMMLVGGLPSLP